MSIRRISVTLLITAMLLGGILEGIAYQHNTPTVGHTVISNDGALDEEHPVEFSFDPVELLAPTIAQRFEAQPSEAALDFFTTALQLAIFGYNAVKADQPLFRENQIATANAVHNFPRMFARELGRGFLSSGTVAKSLIVNPLKGPTGYSNPDGTPEMFTELLEIDYDAGGGPPTDWVEVETDGLRSQRIEREGGKAYERNFKLSYADVPVGKRRVMHWRSSQEKGGKTVMSVYAHPTSLKDINDVVEMKKRWPLLIRRAAGMGTDRKGKVPFVLQGDGLTSRCKVSVYDTEGFKDNEPQHFVGEMTITGFEPLEPIWVTPTMTRVKFIKDKSCPQDFKVYGFPKADKPRWDGGKGYDVSGSTTDNPAIVKLRNQPYMEGGE